MWFDEEETHTDTLGWYDRVERVGKSRELLWSKNGAVRNGKVWFDEEGTDTEGKTEWEG